MCTRYIPTSKSGSGLHKSPGIASTSFSKSCRDPDDVKSVRGGVDKALKNRT